MRLYFKYFKTQVKANLTYRASTVLASFGQLLGTITTLIEIYLLFGKFNHLCDYSFEHILITYAIVIFVFSFNEMIFREFGDASVWNIIYPLLGIVFCIIDYIVFNLCMKKYKSCG